MRKVREGEEGTCRWRTAAGRDWTSLARELTLEELAHGLLRSFHKF